MNGATEAKRIKREYDERDPVRLCAAMGILLRFAPMGTNARSCKGFYLYQSKVKAITINDQLDEDSQRIILAHEIGHAVGHSPLAKIVAFHDFAMLADTSIMEYEANEFAAEYLLDDEEVLDELNENDFFNAASSLDVPPELLIFKLRLLKRQGHKFDLPMQPNGNFLKKISGISYECRVTEA